MSRSIISDFIKVLTLSLLYQTGVINCLMMETGLQAVLVIAVLRLSKEEHPHAFILFQCGTIYSNYHSTLCIYCMWGHH